MAPHDDPPPRFQFRLSSLLIGITAACIVFALVGRFGVEGFLERMVIALTVATIFAPLIDLYRWWREDDI